MQSTRYSSQISIKLEYFQQIFKFSNVKFHENPSSGSRVGSMRKDIHDEPNSGFSQFCELA